MAEVFTRRDFLDSTLLASGAVLLGGASPQDLLAQQAAEWDGYSGVGDYARANGNTYDVVTEGHKIRDGVYARIPAKNIEDAGSFDCVVVGGGISGLASALFFQRRTGGKKTCLVIEDHVTFGGLARGNEFNTGAERLVSHQGSAMFFPPLPGSFLESFYHSVGIDRSFFDYQEWDGQEPALALGRTPYFAGSKTSAFFFGPKFGKSEGMLLVDPWGKNLEGAPIAEQAKRELLAMRGKNGIRARCQPKEHGDEQARKLDGMTLEQHLMEEYGLSRETVRAYLSPVSGGGSGIGADALSAYADYAADVLLPWQYEKGSQMFPGGNAGVARHIAKALIPDAIPGSTTMANVNRSQIDAATFDRPNQSTRIRTSATVISVEQESSRIKILYARNGKLFRVSANSAIMAGGSWTAKHIVRDLPSSHREAYAQFHRSPCLVANVALRNWRFLYKQGIHEIRWFEGIGNYTAVRKIATFGPVSPTISPDSPVVLMLKILFSYPGKSIHEQVSRGRAELLSTSFRDYEKRIREQLTMMFSGTGFDANRDITGLILNRWGHAYASPQPGFFFGANGKSAPGEVLRNKPVGRIAFANSDVTGIMDHRMSIIEAERAVKQVLARPRQL